MRELVYLSERKLRQFQDERPPGWFRRIKEVGFKAPFGVGEAKVPLTDESASPVPSLDRVLRKLEKSDRVPEWFEDEEISTGDWVTFETGLISWSDTTEGVGAIRPGSGGIQASALAVAWFLFSRLGVWRGKPHRHRKSGGTLRLQHS